MRIMTFSPSNNQVVVQTYSPFTDEYRTESNHEFFFNYNMESVQHDTVRLNWHQQQCLFRTDREHGLVKSSGQHSL